MFKTPWLIVATICGFAGLWIATKRLIVVSDDKTRIVSDERSTGAGGSTAAVPCGNIVLRIGEIEPGARVEKEFEITGCGDVERQIGRITTSCGCLACKVNDNILGVGNSLQGTITVQAKSIAGRFGTTARIELLGPVPSFATVKVEGIVVPVVVSTPSQLTVEGRDLNQGREVQFLIEDASGTGIELAPVKPLPSWIASVSVETTPQRDAVSTGQSKHSKAWNVTAVVQYDGLTPSYGELKFDVRGPHERSIAIPIAIKPTVSSHHLNPSQFVFRVQSGVDPMPKKVILRLPKTLQLNELPRIEAKDLEPHIGTAIRRLETNVFEIEAIPRRECSNVRGVIAVEWVEGDYTASTRIPVIVQKERSAEDESGSSL